MKLNMLSDGKFTQNTGNKAMKDYWKDKMDDSIFLEANFGDIRPYYVVIQNLWFFSWFG